MTTITEFLLARIAEDEAVATAATPGPWDAKECAPCTARGRLDVVVWGNDENIEVASWCDDDEFSRTDAKHIARHDPARVLAECAAKRAIIDAHPIVDDLPPLYCDVCVTGHNAERWPCPTVRALATVYADHEDYQPEWVL